MINKNEITALIITSAIKSIPEIRKNMYAISKVTHNLNFIEETLENIRNFSGIDNFIIVHDFKIDSKFSLIHSKNLFKIENEKVSKKTLIKMRLLFFTSNPSSCL